jgi:hypothetical protein
LPLASAKAHGNQGSSAKEFAMRSGRSDVSWFLRAARVVPVIAGAALLGGMIGGFAMFAIDSALTWEPASQSSQSRAEARADNQASAVNPQPTKPVRIVGGAIPDPSAGMSAPPPAPQQQHSAATPSQISSQLLTPKPLGPASQLQPQTASTAPASASTATRWPDALSRAHQNAANAANTPNAQQQTAPPPTTVQTNDRAANKNNETDRKEASGGRAVSADDQSGADISRHGRHSRRHAIAGANGFRPGGDDDGSTAASSPRRQAARSYDRLYDSYGNRRDQSYSRPRGQSYGEASDDQESYSSRGNRSYRNTRQQFYGDVRDEQNDAASRSDLSRSDTRRYGRDARYRGRSHVIDREQSEQSDRNQAYESARPRPEPFWGGGFFRRGDQDDD